MYPSTDEDNEYGTPFDGGDIADFATLTDDYESDTFCAEFTIKNVGDSDGVPATVILAVYKDGALYDLANADVTVPEVDISESGKTYRVACTVEDFTDGVYTAKAMVWNSLGGVSPYTYKASVIAED